MTMKKITFLSALLAAAFALPGASHAAGEAKNIIFFLGDGMGPATVTAARLFKYGEAGQLNMEKLPRTARIKTFSNDAQTTDSAPSMAAYMTGVKMNNEVLSMSSSTVAVKPTASPYKNNCLASNGSSVPTILELAKAQGKLVGAVTTTELTHATPAATYSHICHRDAAYDIAMQAVPGGSGFNSALGDGVDVMFGGGANHFTPFDATGNTKGRPDGRDLTKEMQAKGYTYVNSKAGFDAIPTGTAKVLGLFSATSHLKYELDRVKDAVPTQPSLSEMTARAIDILSKGDKGYFLMVEGGRIDHALHATNAKRALTDAVAFDEAIKTALGKVDLSNTLIVVTADHDHTMTINGYAKKGNPVLDISRSYRDGSVNKDADGKTYTTLVFGNGPNRPDLRTDIDSTVAQGDDYLQESGIKLSSETHGGGDVMLMATGAGAGSFKGTLDNTKVFSLLKSAYGF
jgi:alkaline phosphatase